MNTPVRLLCAALSGASLLAQSDWRLVAAANPSARVASRMAWVPTTQTTVLFGGAGTTSFFDDMWSWNGSAWTQLSATGAVPSPRTGYSWAFDSARNKLVLFGGTLATGAGSNETWEWDTNAWTQLTPATSPSARTEAAMAYWNGQVVLFGGTANGSGAGARFGDTWTWDGTNWTQAATTGPSARFDHAMAADPVASDIKLFGGMTQALPSLSGYTNDLWSWNGSAWSLVTTATAPSARRHHGMAFDTGRNALVMFGGTAGGSSNFADTWTWDSATGWNLLPSTVSPSARHAHSMSYDPVRREMLVHGGNTAASGNAGSQTWALAGPVPPQTFDWRAARNTTPGDRHVHSLTWIPTTQSTLMFGGAATPGGFVNEMWNWDGATWTQIPTPAIAPSPRGGHFASYDLLRNRLVVFGGIISTATGATSDETWEWDGFSWTQKFPANKPSPRCLGAMTYGLGRTILFGGQVDGSGANARYNDTWSWNGSNWTQVASTGPSARFGATMAFDSVASDIKLFGGNVSGSCCTEQNDLWSWNGFTWTQVTTPVAPPVRRLQQMTFDRSRNELIVFGGIQGSTGNLGDTWAYRPSTGWLEVSTIARPSGRHAPAMAYDEIRKEVVLHGGTGCTSAEATETWVSPGAFTQSFGTGCSSSVGVPLLSAVTRPSFGSTFQLQGSNLVPNSFNWIVLGFSNTTWNTIPLPFNLTQLGFPLGCTLLVPDDALFWTLSDGAGTTNFSLGIPAAQALFSIPIYFQCATYDPTLPNAWPLAWSSGLTARLGF